MNGGSRAPQRSIGLFYEETEAYLRSDTFCAPLVASLELILAEHKLALRKIDTASPLDDLAGLSGVIFLAAKSAPLAAALRDKLPTLLLLPDFLAPTAPVVMVDDAAMGRMAAERLLGFGRKRLVVVSGHDPVFDTAAPYQLRTNHFLAAARNAGVAVEHFTSAFTHVFGSSGADASRPIGDAAAALLLSREVRPDGIFAVNDSIAAEVAAWFASAGCAIPEEVSFIGCDNLPLARDLQLSTIHVPKSELAEAAWRVLRAAMVDRKSLDVLLPPRFLARQTTPERKP